MSKLEILGEQDSATLVSIWDLAYEPNRVVPKRTWVSCREPLRTSEEIRALIESGR